MRRRAAVMLSRVPPGARRWFKRIASTCVVTSMVALAVFAAVWHAFPFPLERLDQQPESAQITDRTGRMLAMRVGSNDQWRNPVPLEAMSPYVTRAIVAVEDERFYHHPGVDPLAVTRAAGQNVAAGEVVSGASTLTMQVCRMMDERPRTFRAKVIESFRALQLEQLRTKPEILAAYLNMAPFGGNVRGIQAAAQRYFGVSASELSLGQAALLAGLPQSPERYRPDRNPQAAAARRRTVLRRMFEAGMITADERDAAAAEPVDVQSDRALFGGAPHAAELALRLRPRGGQLTLDSLVQQTINEHVALHRAALPADADVAVVAIDIRSGDLLAMVGSADVRDPIDGQVNGAVARRSPGSALKPFVYAAAFEAGRLSPDALVYDVPIERAGWTPANFSDAFVGEIAAADALRRSLNVPALLVTESTGLSRTIGTMEAAGVSLAPGAPARGGLAVATGAVETNLLDLTNAYATLGRGGVRQRVRLFVDEPTQATRAIDRDVAWAVNDVLSSAHRAPRGLDSLSPQQPHFMWKTGTSSGRRDAWAVGHNGGVAVGVWVGRFAGGGDASFVGAKAAEPLLSALFASPELRGMSRPFEAWSPWSVSRPIAPPESLRLAGQPRIMSPSMNARFRALDEHAVIHLDARAPAEAVWLLNGMEIDLQPASRLVLRPGSYELRCVARSGASTAVRFAVEASR